MRLGARFSPVTFCTSHTWTPNKLTLPPSSSPFRTCRGALTEEQDEMRKKLEERKERDEGKVPVRRGESKPKEKERKVNKEEDRGEKNERTGRKNKRGILK